MVIMRFYAARNRGGALNAKVVPGEQRGAAMRTVQVRKSRNTRVGKRYRWWRCCMRKSLERLPIVDAVASACHIRAPGSSANPGAFYSKRIPDPRLREIQPERAKLDRFAKIPAHVKLRF